MTDPYLITITYSKFRNFSPFQLPPKSPFGNSDEIQPESDPIESSNLTTDDLLFSPINENTATSSSVRKGDLENINDEFVGRKLMIEKHLEHQMILKKHNLDFEEEPGSPTLQLAKKECSQTLENDTYSLEDISHTFVNKGDSETIQLIDLATNRPTNFFTNMFESKIQATTKEMRKLRQQNFLVDELSVAREASSRQRD